MNRRIVLILIVGLTLVALLSQILGTGFAQDTDLPGSGDDGDGSQPPPAETRPELEEPTLPVDQPEPVVIEVDNPDALVPSNFSYQGQLKHNGVPVNGNCDFIWDIFDISTGGVSLATDSDTDFPVVNGLFMALVDIPISLIDGRGLYLEVQVRCPAGIGSYTTLTPRQPLSAAPYALGLRLPFSHTISNTGSPIFAVTNSSSSTSSPSFLGSSAGGDGVRGISTGGGSADNGVYGETNSPASTEGGVKGVSSGAAAGGYFTSVNGYGVYGTTSSATDFGGYFNNSTATTSGGALYANGDAKQSLAGDGFVKAGVYVNDCGTNPSITSYFNNVNTTAITVIAGAAVGSCTVDFGFNVSNRYIVAISRSTTPRIITFFPDANVNRVDFYKFDADGVLITGDIMVLVY